ncbi:RagB/SusD family nutrient uptake outer membrane protein [Pedobacter sp. GSP4]|uniref:RagB/SusD family nutrient uptake outer membrane protein n=1 Tax=Pedobacter sp. GSP4 TaxID=3453716 RepID=UPI003EE97735
MLKSKYNIIICSLVFMVMASTGCKKIIEIDAPLNQVTTDLVFASDKLATSARSGLFSSLSQASTQSTNLTVYSSLQADDLLYLSTVGGLQEYNNNSYNALSTGQASIFSEWYAIIYRANAIINGLETSTGASDAIKKQYIAEAKFVRAYCYFNLVNTFGDVPLVLVTDPTITAFQPRESTANIYTKIIADLSDAKANLLVDYSATAGDRIGVNKFVATAFLARVYLFTGNYAAAESNASEVIASSLYSLIPRATMGTGLFIKNSAESIWQMSPPIVSTNQYTNEAAAFIPSTTTTVTSFVYRIDPRFTALFETTDLRRINWMNHTTLSGTVYTLPFKYKYRTNALAVTAGVTELQTVIRLAEVYLIRAEARARTGTNLTGALSDLNAIQTRAAATLSTSTIPATLLSDIALENRKELFCEQAFRWFNLKRTGEADAVLSAIKTGYTPKSKLLPIPQAALDANYTLTQNPGY